MDVRRSRVPLLVAPVLGLGLALGGCAASPAPAPSASETFDAADGIRSSAELFFALLAAGDEKGAAEEIEPAVDFGSPLSLLVTPSGVYSQMEDRPKITSVDDVSSDGDGKSGTATVTYEMAGTEHTDTVELRLRTEDEVGADEYAVVLPADEFGLDATGVELLPADTVYRIHGVDVSAAFQEARALADAGHVPRVPAFGGTYPLEVTVPGENGFTATVVLQTSTFFGGTGTDGVLTAFAHEHGF